MKRYIILRKIHNIRRDITRKRPMFDKKWDIFKKNGIISRKEAQFSTNSGRFSRKAGDLRLKAGDLKGGDIYSRNANILQVRCLLRTANFLVQLRRANEPESTGLGAVFPPLQFSIWMCI